MNVTKKTVVALSAVGLLVLVLNLVSNRPAPPSYGRAVQDESQLLIAESSEGLVRRREDSGGDGDSGGNGDSGGDGDSTPEVDAKLWGKPGVALQSCWSQHLPKRTEKTWGFVTVTTSNGPHNHRAQIADAVVVAAQLKASLVLPNVKEAAKEPNSRFEDIYNIKHFISSLDGVVRVVGKLPEDKAKMNRTVTSIPLRATREQINQTVRPVFEQQGGLVVLGTFLSAIKGEKEDQEMTALRCLVMYKALQYVSGIQKLGDRVISRMREAAPAASGRRFVAVDLQVDLLGHKTCNVTDAKKKRCLEPGEVGQFLKRVGFPSETAVYLTQSRWISSLESLQDMFPNVHTKEYSMPFNEENQYLLSGKTQFEQAVDFYICARSDVFVPTVPGVFYAHVAGQRISAGLNHIIVPTYSTIPGSDESQFVGAGSPYVEKKNHNVYLCFCEPALTSQDSKSEGAAVETNLKSKPVSVPDKISSSKKEDLKKLQQRDF